MEKTGKKTLKIEKDKFNLTLAKIALSVMAEHGTIEKVLEKFIEVNKNGEILMEYRQSQLFAKELGINYATFKICVHRLIKRGLLKKEGYCLYLHPMLSGSIGKMEIVIG